MNALDAPSWSYCVSASTSPKSVTGSNIIHILLIMAKKIGYQCLGFFPHEIGLHSLRSGGAMTLHQVHVPDSTIKIIGRWHSYTFLVYLRGK